MKTFVHSFIVIPFLIAIGCVILVVMMHLLTKEQKNVYDFLEDVRTGGLTKRWQSAFELSKILVNPDLIPREERFSAELLRAFEQAGHDDRRVRQYLALAMGRTGNPVFVRPLIDHLEEEKEENLPAFIYALGMLKGKESAAALCPYLEHPQARIRSLTAAALGTIEEPRSVPFLEKSLNDPEPNVQWTAAVSLARMGDAAGADILLKMLDRKYWRAFAAVDPQEQDQLILAAMEAAGFLDDIRLKQRIGELARTDANMNVRAAAMNIVHR